MDKNEWIGYRITNTINGRYYIGVVKAYNWHKKSVAYTHKRQGFIPAKPRGYMGSGQAIREAIIKHGDAVFERKILARFDNADDADAWEIANVIMQDVDPLSYNLRSGGKRGFKVGKIARAKYSKAKMGIKSPFYKDDAPRLASGRISKAYYKKPKMIGA